MGITKKDYEDFNYYLELLNPCMDDYLYIYDLKNDRYKISKSALDRFALPSDEFSNVPEMHKDFVYPQDYELLNDELNSIIKGEKKFHSMQYRWLNSEGQPIWIACRGSVVFDEEGKAECLVGCINEVGKTQLGDNVSGLLGPRSLIARVREYAKSGIKKTGYILRIGIDDFHDINESKGIQYGNKVLKEVGSIILGQIDTAHDVDAYRMMADEFTILDMSGSTIDDAIFMYEKIAAKIENHIRENGYEVYYTISGGIIGIDDSIIKKYDQIEKNSIVALRQAKKNGKNCYAVLDIEEYERISRRRELSKHLHNAVANGYEGFECNFQPIVECERGRVVGAETLLRFTTPDGEKVSPAEFIPILEDQCLIIPVGKFVMDKAMAMCEEVRKVKRHFKVSFNVSSVQVKKSNVVEDIVSCMNRHNLDAESIIVELTESKFFEADQTYKKFIRDIHRHGILLALDDFGTGYSNFSYLYNMSPYELKIDRSFTVKALNGENEFKILEYMVSMSHSLGIRFVIEGIEELEEANRLKGILPDYFQGYYYGRPCERMTFFEKYVS